MRTIRIACLIVAAGSGGAMTAIYGWRAWLLCMVCGLAMEIYALAGREVV